MVNNMTTRLITYLKEHKAAAFLAVLLAVGTILAGMGLMTSSGYLISRSAERPMIVDLFMVTAAVRFFGISRAVVRYFERVVSHNLTFKILLRIRTTFYERLDAFSQKWLMTKRPGELLTGMTSDIETMQNVYLRILSPVIVAVIICSITFALLLFFDVALAIAVLLIFLVNGLAVPVLARRLARGTGKKERRAAGRMKVFMVDKIQGMHDALWLNDQKSMIRDFSGIQQHIKEVQHSNANTSGLVEGLNALLANLAVFASLLLAIPLVLNGDIRGVMLAALMLGVFSSFEALQGLSTAFVRYDSFREATGNLTSLTKPDMAAPAQTGGQDRKGAGYDRKVARHPRIAFRKVSFAYDQTHDVVKNISFELNPGQKTAIVGHTGSGKSTLINLLTGLWEPVSGEIKVDEIPIAQLDMKHYRSMLGIVSQDTYIFNSSVRENLLIADAGASDRQLESMLKEVGLEFLASKLDLVLGSQGMKLSGGERQLFALARALLKQNDIWVFDELSANMDAATERKILDKLWKNLNERSLLTITHRLVDMDKMDQILVLKNGNIIERGNHSELLAAGELYAKMYAQQMELLAD